jgi:MoxR-like ATPase
VILTSNRTAELHDALKRRCLFHWITHPGLEREVEIVRLRVPGVPERLAAEAAAFVAGLRRADLAKAPGWPRRSTGRTRSPPRAARSSTPPWSSRRLGSVLKYHEDFELVRDDTVAELLREARAAAAAMAA